MFFYLIMRRCCKVPYVLSQMWNSVGIVRGYNDDQDNAIDVEFHDTAIHHAMHLTNTLGHTMADLSQEAVLLACEGTDELARYKILVLIIYFISLVWTFLVNFVFSRAAFIVIRLPPAAADVNLAL